jgi:hypothetical protein
MTRFWFFGGGGKIFISTAECAGLELARRLAFDYNRQPGSLGPIDLITDAKVPAEATQRVKVDVAPPLKPRAGDREP